MKAMRRSECASALTRDICTRIRAYSTQPIDVGLVGAWGSLALYLAWLVFRSVTGNEYFDGEMADGPFQLYNTLRRLAAGHALGKDFVSFHGLGAALAHYPVFVLFGKTLYASELSRLLVSPLLFIAANALFLRAARVSATWAILLALCVSVTDPLIGLRHLVYPANSLLGVRATMPLLGFTALLWLGSACRFESIFSTRWYETAAGFLVALAIFSGTEHGLALFGSLVVLFAVWPPRHQSALGRIKSVAVLSCAAFAGLLLIGVLTAGTNLFEPIQYAFVDIPGDQFWYFGTPPNAFARCWWDLVTPDECKRVYLLWSLIAVCVWGSRKLSGDQGFGHESPIFAAMLTYGLASTASNLGYLGLGNVQSCARVLVLLSLVLGYRLAKSVSLRWRFEHRAAVGLLSVWLVCLAFAKWEHHEALMQYHSLSKHNQRQNDVAVQRLPTTLRPDQIKLLGQHGIPLSPMWTETLLVAHDLFLANGAIADGRLLPGTLWSTYSGLIEASYASFHPSTDYVIHALGERRRRAYVERFRKTKPLFVVTIRPNVFEYEEWLWNTTWDFYQGLVEAYDVEAVTSAFVFWKRRAAAANDPEPGRETHIQAAREPRNGKPFYLDIDRTRLRAEAPVVVVRLEYEISNPWRPLPVFGNVPRPSVMANNVGNRLPAALIPYRREMSFPLDVRHAESPRLHMETYSLFPGVSAKITSFQVLYPRIPKKTYETLWGSLAGIPDDESSRSAGRSRWPASSQVAY